MRTDAPLLATLIRRVHLSIRQQLHADVQTAGHSSITPAHMYVFQSPGADGVRPTELAGRTNMTKQAMNHLLTALERDGYLRRVPEPSDARGSVVRLTARGREVERIMRQSSLAIERAWARRFGRDAVESLRRQLAELDSAAEEEVQQDRPDH